MRVTSSFPLNMKFNLLKFSHRWCAHIWINLIRKSASIIFMCPLPILQQWKPEQSKLNYRLSMYLPWDSFDIFKWEVKSSFFIPSSPAAELTLPSHTFTNICKSLLIYKISTISLISSSPWTDLPQIFIGDSRECSWFGFEILNWVGRL